jgi:GNAT superfamily N-acetyltransferase
MNPVPGFVIRKAQLEDVPVILRMIRALAEYENLSDAVTATQDQLRDTLFERRAAEVLLAYVGNKAAGFAVFFHNFSTFLGRPGMYLEDLFVRPEWRGRGLGKQLFARVAQLAVERGCGRMEWSVLDWNEPAIGFYRNLGAHPMDDWTVFRLAGAALTEVAARADRGEQPAKPGK